MKKRCWHYSHGYLVIILFWIWFSLRNYFAVLDSYQCNPINKLLFWFVWKNKSIYKSIVFFFKKFFSGVHQLICSFESPIAVTQHKVKLNMQTLLLSHNYVCRGKAFCLGNSDLENTLSLICLTKRTAN